MKHGEIVVLIGYYNFTKFHQNQMKNKKVFINNPFLCSEFQNVSRIVKIAHSAAPHHPIHPFCVNPNKLTPFVVIKTNPNKTLSAVTLPNLLANGLENKKNEIKTYVNYL